MFLIRLLGMGERSDLQEEVQVYVHTYYHP